MNWKTDLYPQLQQLFKGEGYQEVLSLTEIDDTPTNLLHKCFCIRVESLLRESILNSSSLFTAQVLVQLMYIYNDVPQYNDAVQSFADIVARLVSLYDTISLIGDPELTVETDYTTMGEIKFYFGARGTR